MQRKPLASVPVPGDAPFPSQDGDDAETGDYPMDFYANDSRGPWTPRHGMHTRAPRKGGKSNLAILKRTKAKLAAQQAAAQAQQAAVPKPSA